MLSHSLWLVVMTAIEANIEKDKRLERGYSIWSSKTA